MAHNQAAPPAVADGASAGGPFTALHGREMSLALGASATGLSPGRVIVFVPRPFMHGSPVGHARRLRRTYLQ